MIIDTLGDEGQFTLNGFITTPTLTSSGYLFAHNLYFHNDNFLTRYPHLNTAYSTPVVGPDETIYFGGYVGEVGAMKPDGTPKWEMEFETTTTSSSKYVSSRTGEIISVKPIITRNNALYIGGEAGNLYKLELDEVDEVPPSSRLDYENEKLHDLYDFDTFMNKDSWSFQTGDWVKAIAVDKEGNSYVGNESGKIYALSPDGTKKWEVELDSHDIVYDIVISPKQSLYVLSKHSGI